MHANIASTDGVAAVPRARGALAITVRGGPAGLENLRQSGSSRCLFPKSDKDAVTAVALNTAGGVTGGDRFELRARARPGARLILTTQTAERIYRAPPGAPGEISTALTLEDTARLHWLPQETILFNGAALNRHLRVEMAGSARFLGVETLVFGRQAMGEAVTRLALRDRIEIRRDGALVFADALKLTGDSSQIMGQAATGQGALAVAGIVLAAPDAERWLEPLRAALPAQGGASLIRDGVIFARIVAPDSYALRQSLIPALTRLAEHSLPRTWTI